MTAKTNKQNQFKCSNCAKNNYFHKRHQARSQEGVERQPSHSQIFRNLNFFSQNCTWTIYPAFTMD